MQTMLDLPPAEGNPRNSEGDFIQLKDGRILFIFTHFTGGAGDNAAAHLAGRYSKDRGLTWTEDDAVIVKNEGYLNVMSVSLLRLQNGEIALFYLLKRSKEDCRPQMRVSNDEGVSWSSPVECIKDDIGYYVLNNARVIQLDNGRLVMPVALHHKPAWDAFDRQAMIACYLSDDNGMTWYRKAPFQKGFNHEGERIITQEPGVVALKDGRLMMFCRTDAGSQYISYSEDNGESWTAWQPSDIISPLSPASIRRIPDNGDLLLVWNDHKNINPELRDKRTPLSVTFSRDEGRTWEDGKVLEKNPDGWYCYTAIQFVDEHVMLAYCAGDCRKNNGLARTQIVRFSLDWLYAGR
jgi:sialidase-1